MPADVEKEKPNEPIDVDAEVEGKDEEDEVVAVDGAEQGEGEEEGEDEDEEDDGEGEFEVETILDHKNSNGKFTYLVSWRGYGPEHNTWEPQEHVEHAQDVVTAYWNTRPKTNSKQTAKRGRPSSTPQPSKPVKNAKTSNGSRRGKGGKSTRQAEEDEFDDDVPEFEATHVDSMDKYGDVRDWEELVKTVDTIEKTPTEGLVVYMTMIGGERVGQSTEVAYKRCPQKILKFYESHLKWKMATD